MPGPVPSEAPTSSPTSPDPKQAAAEALAPYLRTDADPPVRFEGDPKPAPPEELDDETGADEPDYYPPPPWLAPYVDAELRAGGKTRG